MVLKRFIHNDTGAVAVLMGVLIVPLILSVGVAVDFANSHSARSTLQSIADAAALAGASTSTNKHAIAKAFFDQEVAARPQLAGATSRINLANGVVTVTGNHSVPTKFMKLAGFDEVAVQVTSVAETGSGPLELVIALDATTSMASLGSRQQAYQAIEQVLGEVLDSAQSSSGAAATYVSLLPFSDRVAIPTLNQSWVTGARPANWRGCVRPRERPSGSFQFALDDQPPSVEPFEFWDESFGTNMENGGGVCIEPFAGPTTSRQEIQALVSQIWNDGTGRFDVALAWGWRLLSPKWKGLFGNGNYPEDYGARRKVLVMITDFRSAAYQFEVNPNPMTVSAQNTPFDDTPIGRDHLIDLCDRIKSTGIELWLVGVNEMPENQKYFQSCAGSRYVQAGNLEEFVSGLRKASGLGTARLTQ